MASPEQKSPSQSSATQSEDKTKPSKAKGRPRGKDSAAAKRRCVSTACIACRRRKSKCDGNLPSCAACASVYGTECVYDPNSDHRRKGVYKKDIDNLKTRNTTLQTLVQGILNYPEDEVIDLVKEIRSCENLDDVAEAILSRSLNFQDEADYEDADSEDEFGSARHTFEKELSGKMGELRLENGNIRFIGGTSNLLFDDSDSSNPMAAVTTPGIHQYIRQDDAVRSWTSVTGDVDLILHLLNMYFTWHYTYFTTLSKYMFFQDFFRGKPVHGRRKNEHCTSLLVNAMLALGCHFTSWPAARADPRDSATAGDHFFKEAKRLIVDNDEYVYPRLATVQALALMSVREAGCGREAKGWVYSGMSFRMACDLGLNVQSDTTNLDEHEVDARRVTFWGCFLFDKCWSNYLGRPPQLPLTNVTVPKFDVFPSEDSEMWSPWTDSGLDQSYLQPSRTRAVALMISALCEISNDIILAFYGPGQVAKSLGKQAEIKRLSEFHTRLEGWRRKVPKELEPREGQLPHVLVMHMFFNLLFIHLFRPFLKVAQPNGPLPQQVQPRRICTQAAAMISKLLRMYKRTHGLRQICNIAVYIAHSACTIHLLNLPDKDARRDIVHGVRQLEEIAEGWLCARRTLLMLGTQTRKWSIELPEDAAGALQRVEEKYGSLPSPRSNDDHIAHQLSPSMVQPMTLLPASNHKLSQMMNTSTQNTAPPGIETSNGQQSSPAASHLATQRAPPGSIHYPTSAASDFTTLNSPTTLQSIPPTFLDSSFQPSEDSKDWWMRDQSSIFDSWERRNSINMTTIQGGVDTAEAGSGNGARLFDSIDDMKDKPKLTADGYNMGYLDFGPPSIYGYNGDS